VAATPSRAPRRLRPVQHEARGADKAITDAIDALVDDETREDDDGDEASGTLAPAG
jgi:hypothetical protein